MNRPAVSQNSASGGRDSIEPVPMTGRTCVADVEPEQVRWLWPGYIPIGKIVTLDGDPGLGKSAIALTMAAVVSRGGTWPDGTHCDVAGDVLVMTAEDGVADTIRPRLDAAGAELSRVHVIEHGVDEHGEPKPITLGDVDQLDRHIVETGARLLIVDVLMAYLPGDAHKDQDVRKALTPFAKLAERTGCTMLLLRHLKKNTGGEPTYLGAGSVGIVGAARAGLMVTRDPDRPEDVRILTSVKSNLARSPKSLAYRLVGANNGSVIVEWLGEDSRTATELVADRRKALGIVPGQVAEFVAGRAATTSEDVAEEFGLTKKLANQHLNRLHTGGFIGQLSRGVYGPVHPPAAEHDAAEDLVDVEDSEVAEDIEVVEGTEDSSAKEGGDDTPESEFTQQRPPADDRTADDPQVGHCPECAGPLGNTGKCGPCIVMQLNAAAATGQADESDD